MPPPDVSDASIELLERRLTERITEQVRTRLFVTYAAIGTAVGAAFGLVGYSALDWAKERANAQINQRVDELTRSAATASAQVTALQSQLDVQLKVIDALARRSGRVIDDVEITLKTFEPKSRRLEQAIADIDELEERVRPVRGATDLAERNRTDIERLGTELATLAQQLKALIEVGRSAPSPASPSTSATYETLAGATAKVATGAASITQEIAASRERTTVYVQFAGLERSRLDEVAKALADKGFTFPPAERTDAAGRLFEVRYFWPGDEAAARRLAALATAVAREKLDDNREARVQDLTRWPRTKPRQGTIELWYGVAPR